MNKAIRVRGAREHNLKGIDVEFPRDRLIVMTGLSGSGKSSLAFDTIYAEGQRRYVESLSAYARQFLELMEKPDVEHIDGLSPAISIEQKTTSKNPRSTVGTVTEIHDYMRLLWARVGVPWSPVTGLPIESQSVSQMVDRIMAMNDGARLMLLAPVVRGRKGEYRKELGDLLRSGFQRVRIDGAVHMIEDAPRLDKKRKHTIEVVVDRVIKREGLEGRLADSIETVLGLSDGLLVVIDVDSDELTTLSSRFACPVSGFTIEEIEPRLFSFNNPFGACPECSGIGTRLVFDINLIVPDPRRSLEGGAIVPWQRSSSLYYKRAMRSVARHFGASLHTPFEDLPQDMRTMLIEGSGDEKIRWTEEFGDEDDLSEFRAPFRGVIPGLERRLRETSSEHVREELGRYQAMTTCEACNGFRLKPEALAVRIAGKHIAEVSEYSIGEARNWFAGVARTLTDQQAEIARRILAEINDRLTFLSRVGLDYLALSRRSGTLSGGEGQRIRLASQIGSGLTGVLYVLDEPSIGLHQRDNQRLLETLTDLRNLGNTVIVVEHDEEAIRAADHVIDLGPGAGEHGGHIVAQGTPADVMATEASLTGQYLVGTRQIDIPGSRRGSNRFLTLTGASANNLKAISARFPVGALTCVTGVSGSGKSTLVNETLYLALNNHVGSHHHVAGAHTALEGADMFDKVVDIDQSPIGRTPRSNPATYTGAFTPIREWFAGLPESKARGYQPGRFSFNVEGGRCEACRGDGLLRIEMHFLADVYVQCDTCRGRRYNRETLEVKFRGKSIADVLDMTVEEGRDFFQAVPAIRSKLDMLMRVGLGYIRVGQPATTLSGGEAQRVKLAKELSRRATGRTLYILDEPTTGLHFEDVRKLLEVLHALVDTGNTVVVIEHNLEVIKTADWIIDLGPEGGDGGGHIVAEGEPEAVAGIPASHTGRYLAGILSDAGAVTAAAE